jgi:hypothetical protein
MKFMLMDESKESKEVSSGATLADKLIIWTASALEKINAAF